MKWRDEYSEYVGWGLIFAAGAMTLGSFMSWGSKSFWDIATAIGTVGAAGAAVGIALWQDRLRRRDSVLNARLIAATLVGPLGRNIQRMKDSSSEILQVLSAHRVHSGVDLITAMRNRRVAYANLGQTVLGQVSSIEEISHDHLVIVAALKSPLAEQIAIAQADAKYVIEHLVKPSGLNEAGWEMLATMLSDSASLLKPAWLEYQMLANSFRRA